MHDLKGVRVLSGAVRVEYRGCRKVWKEYAAPIRAGGREKDVLVFSVPPGDTVGWWWCEREAQVPNGKRISVGFAVPELLKL